MANSKSNLLSLREREAKHQEHIRRFPRFSSAEKSELEDIQQLISELQKRGPLEDENDEGEDGIVW